jgi:hypothetical protein
MGVGTNAGGRRGGTGTEGCRNGCGGRVGAEEETSVGGKVLLNNRNRWCAGNYLDVICRCPKDSVSQDCVSGISDLGWCGVVVVLLYYPLF